MRILLLILLSFSNAFSQLKISTVRGKASFFNIYKENDCYFLIIPDKLFNRDVMVVSRLTSNCIPAFAGDAMNINTLRFIKDKDSVYILSMQQDRAVTLPGTIGTYAISGKTGFAFNCDSINYSTTINITAYLEEDNEDLFFYKQSSGNIFGTSLDNFIRGESFLEDIQCYSDHIEIRSIKVYDNTRKKFRLSINTSLLLLNVTAAKIRYSDSRLNYYTKQLPSPDSGKVNNVIIRWRLKPKREDIDKYKKGILVEPEKPIVFYIDPATPPQWVPTIISAVNAWQKTFEKAGFKNAIMARRAPTVEENSEWSLYSAKYNSIVFQDNPDPNSSFSNVIDPRSGEIVSTTVRMYKGMFKWFHAVYFTQASPSDAKARVVEFTDDLYKGLLKMLVSHEVGHTLGFDHNQLASNAIPVEKYRDRKWLLVHGLTPSIMDYARCNYVAQPEDSINFEKGLINSIGVYDEWAIEWGYRDINDSPEIEKEVLQRLTTEKVKDKRYRSMTASINDPRVEPESIGDNSVLAGTYGIRNLQFIVAHLLEWGKTSDSNFIGVRYQDIITQLGFYWNNVVVNIGGLYETINSLGEITYTPVESRIQYNVLSFLTKQLFITPKWLITPELVKISGLDVEIEIEKQQQAVILTIFNEGRLRNLLDNESFKLTDLLFSLRKGLFPDTTTDRLLEKLQLFYVANLLTLINPESLEISVISEPVLSSEDRVRIRKALRDELSHIQTKIENVLLPKCNNLSSKMHLLDCLKRMESGLSYVKEKFEK